MSEEAKIKKMNDDARAQFDQEEVVRKALEVAHRIHDCKAAGCDIDPKGKKITRSTQPGG